MNIISFPKLHMTFNINPIAFSIGSRPIYWYALIILTGFLCGLFFAANGAKKRGLSPDSIYDIGIYGLVVGIICARIYYVVFDWDSFKDRPLDIFKTWEGGLAIYGGLIGAIATAYIYCHIKKLPALKLFDECAPGIFIGQIIGRFGNFANAEVYGGETSSLLGMSINGAAPVHPLFLYEAMWNLLGLIIMLSIRNKKSADGQVICGYLFWYGLGRLFLEGMRQNEYILYLIDGVLGVSQVVSALIIVLSVIFFILLTKRRERRNNI